MIQPSRKVIIVDDDEEVAAFLVDALSQKGFAVETATDGESGLALAAKVKPDLILVDILMPRKDGIVFCEALRQDQAISQIPIILMTGVYRDFDFRIFLQKTLVNDFVTKPIQIDELFAKINRLLK